MSYSTPYHAVQWLEAELFTRAYPEGESVISPKPSASGSFSTCESLFALSGGSLAYDVDLKESIPRAKLIVRYARWTGESNEAPARILLTMSTGSSVLNQVFECCDTGGWGDTAPGDWGYVHIPLDISLSPGPVELSFSAINDRCMVCLDGFLLSPGSFHLDHEETQHLDRIRFTDYGYTGLQVSNPGVRNNLIAFQVVSRSFCSRSCVVSARLLRDDAASVTLLETVELPDKPVQSVLEVSITSLNGLAEGLYTLELSLSDSEESLTCPVQLRDGLLRTAEPVVNNRPRAL